MFATGLLKPDNLADIFLNMEDIQEHNVALAEKLWNNMETAFEEGDEDFLAVNIGKLFLEASPMLQAFESLLLSINLISFPMVPSTYKKKVRAWTGFNWPLQ